MEQNTLRLTLESSRKTIQFQKEEVIVGRNDACDLVIDKRNISRKHAVFLYENDKWFLSDKFSTNGTWLNGVHMQPGKKYQLMVNDEIIFGMSEKVIYDKKEQTEENTNIKLVCLESKKEEFAKSQHTDETVFKHIMILLSATSLYFPVEIDINEMMNSADTLKLKPGDEIQLQKDVKMRILTLKFENDFEFVPMFTSNEEAGKGPRSSVIRYYPQDWLPILIKMDKLAVINPFSKSRFYLNKQLIENILLPIAFNKTNISH